MRWVHAFNDVHAERLGVPGAPHGRFPWDDRPRDECVQTPDASGEVYRQSYEAWDTAEPETSTTPRADPCPSDNSAPRGEYPA